MAFPNTGTSPLDAFNRANANTLGGDWTDSIAASDGGMGIDNNAAMYDVPTATPASAAYTVATYGPNCEGWTTLSAKSVGSGSNYIGARITNVGTGDGYIAAVLTGFTPDSCGIFRLDDGVGTQLGSLVSQDYNDSDSIGIECIDDQISFYYGTGVPTVTWDASPLLTRTDGTYGTAGYLGLGGQDGGGVTNSRYNQMGGGSLPDSGERDGWIPEDLRPAPFAPGRGR